MRATIDGAGRVVIPKEIRERQHLKPGTVIEIIETADGVELVVADEGRRATLVEERGYLVVDAPGRTTSTDETLRIRDALRDRKLY